MNSNIENKVIIITGASSGIGEATAKKLGDKGAKLVLGARRIDKLEKLKNQIDPTGKNVISMLTDVTQQNDLGNLAELAVKTYGKIDILINNAGIMPLSPLRNLRTDEWNQMIDVNIKGVLHGIAALLPIFRKQKSGHFINISSVSGRRVYPGGVIYCATKFAVNVISEGLRRELDPSENIKVTVIEPGAVQTELANSIHDSKVQEQHMKWRSSVQLLEPEDIAESIIYVLQQADRVNVDEILIMPREQTA